MSSPLYHQVRQRLQQTFRSHQYPPHEIELRGHFLRLTWRGSLLLTILYLLLGTLQWIRPLLFPWDGLAALALWGLVGLMMRRGEAGIAFGASWLVASVNMLAAFQSQAYGIQHPVTAFYLTGIILAGMLIGGWFLRLWTVIGSAFILIWGILELNGENAVAGLPVASISQLIGVVAFWWGLMGVTSWLVWLFARNLERAVQMARGQTETLAHLVNALTKTPHLDNILSEVLVAIAQQLQAEWATLYFYDPATEMLQIQLGYGNGRVLSPAETQANGAPPIPAATAPLWQELSIDKQPIFIDDITADTRLINRHLLLAQGIQTLLFVPVLRGPDQVLGYFSINSLQPRRYRAEEIELAQALVQNVTLTLQLAELSGQAQQTAVLDERNRMAREIHDTLAQGFTGIVVQLENAEETLTTEPETASRHLNQARQLARENLAEARRSVWELRPGPIQADDLPGGLRSLARQLAPGTAVAIPVTSTGTVYPLTSTQETELLRIAQEAINNALHHAQATWIKVNLHYAINGCTLSVQDNGRGIMLPPTGSGFGITSMQERARRIAADLTITTEPGQGTSVICELPRSRNFFS